MIVHSEYEKERTMKNTRTLLSWENGKGSQEPATPRRIPSPECIIDGPHPEHVFRLFGTMTLMDGAHIDCAGKD